MGLNGKACDDNEGMGRKGDVMKMVEGRIWMIQDVMDEGESNES